MTVKTNGYSNAGRLEALERRRAEAADRQRMRDARDDVDQLILLARRPGDSAREVARIQRRAVA